MKHLFSFSLSCRLVGLLLTLLMVQVARAQTPAWKMAFSTGQTSITTTTADDKGNVYMAGTFSGTAQFGNTELTDDGNGASIFVAKWNPATGYVWALKSSGKANSLFVKKIIIQGTSIYMAGGFGGYNKQPLTFGSIDISSSIEPAGSITGFVVKLTDAEPTTSFTWGQAVNSGDVAVINDIAVSGTSVYLTGSFFGTLAFGTITLTNPGVPGSRPSADMFVAKLVDAGTTSSIAWAKQGGGPGWGVAVSGSNVYVTGLIVDATADFGPFTLTNTNLSDDPDNPSLTNDIYVVKLTDVGASSSYTWVQQVRGEPVKSVGGLAVSGSSIYLTGDFTSGTAHFGTSTLTDAPILLSAVSSDAFVAKITDLGSSASFIWAKQAGGPGYEHVSGLALSGTSMYMTGTYASKDATFGSQTLTSTGTSDIFVTKLTDMGTTVNFAWAAQGGGNTDDDRVNTVSVAGSEVYVGGYFISAADFGTYTLTGKPNSFTGFFAGLSVAEGLPTAGATSLDKLSIFPNPAHALVTVQVPAVPGATQATLTLTDALGRTVRTVRLPATGTTTEISLTGLVPGLYRVQVQAGGQQSSRRFTVQ
jgi:predicted secreted protein